MIRHRLLPALVLLCLVVSAGIGEGQEPTDKKPAEKTKFEPLPMDLLQQIEKTEMKELLEELKSASRLSREGQKLTRFQVLLKVGISKAESYRDRYATPGAEAARKALAMEEVRAALKAVAIMPPGSTREAAYRAFSTKYSLAPESIGQAYQLQKANQQIEALKVKLVYIENQLKELDRKSTVSDLPFVSVGGLATNQTLDQALADIDEMQKKSGTAPVKPPTTERDNLDFLSDLIEQKK